MIFFLCSLSVLLLCRSHCGFLSDDSYLCMRNFRLKWGDSNRNIIACRADNPSCSCQVGGISIRSHNHKPQLNSSGISLPSVSSLSDEITCSHLLDVCFHQTSVALATESKMMKNVFCCYMKISFAMFQLPFLLCVMLYVREVEETQDWGEKKGDREKKYMVKRTANELEEFGKKF